MLVNHKEQYRLCRRMIELERNRDTLHPIQGISSLRNVVKFVDEQREH